MARAALHRATARVLCQATEVPDKVREALAVVMGPVAPSSTTLEGQWGQPILALEAELSGAMAAARVKHFLADAAVGERLRKELPRRLDDECVLHIRFDKQRAAEGALALGQGDDSILFRAKVAAYPSKHAVGLQVLRDLAS
jgi:RNA-binding protein